MRLGAPLPEVAALAWRLPRRATALVLAIAALSATGCPSAYQRTYDRDLAALQQEGEQQQAQQAALHAEASKYAAVIYFPTGSAVVDQDGLRQIAWFVDKMQPYPQANFLVQGFADSTGSEANNQQLSETRAQAVAAAMAAQGIAQSRMDVRGFGTASAAATNATVQGRRDNRRVEVTVR
jgi:outer membrane protein OmpA-like peptidoglycan-associated protein